MPQHTLASGITDLVQSAEGVAQRLEMHAPWPGIPQTPAAELRSALEQLRTTQANFANARSAKAVAGKRKIAADDALTAWLGKARLAVILARGAQWSESWLDTGFTHRGTNVPKRIEARIALARAVVAFFARNPEFGVRHANVTATDGRQTHDEIVNARISLHEISSACMASKRARDGAERQLRRSMRQVILILRTTNDGTDARWLAFGSNQPNAARTVRIRSAEEAAPITPLSETSPSAFPLRQPNDSQLRLQRAIAIQPAGFQHTIFAQSGRTGLELANRRNR